MQTAPSQQSYLAITPLAGDPIVSPSQISTWNDCWRKWAFDKIEKRPRKTTPEAERGTRVHAILERWAKTGEPPSEDTREGLIARKLLPYAPPPRVATVEGYFMFSVLGIRYRGIKDLVYRDKDLLVVHDWKTTSDLKWALTEEKLRTDPQGLLYALDAFAKEGANELALRWVYGTAAKRPRVRVVETRMRREETYFAFLEHVHVPASQIVLTKRQVRKAHDLRGNPEVCHKYGGCPYRDVCNLTKEERLQALMEHESLRNRLAEQQANGHVQAPTPVPPHLIRQTPDGSLVVATATGQYAPVFQGQDGAYYTNPGVIPQEPQQVAPAAPQTAPEQPVPAAQAAVPAAQAPQGFPSPATAAPAAQAPAQVSQPVLPGVNGAPVAQASTQAAAVQQPTHNPTDINQPLSQVPETAPTNLATNTQEPAKRGRKASTSKSKTLTLDQQVWLAGARAAASTCDPDTIVRAGSAMISAFHQTFGD